MAGRTLTLSLAPEVVAKAKILAAQRRTSVSRLFSQFVAIEASRDRAYRSARRRALSFLDRGLKLGSRRPPREEIHERPSVC
jgi:hypothetical protein